MRVIDATTTYTDDGRRQRRDRISTRRLRAQMNNALCFSLMVRYHMCIYTYIYIPARSYLYYNDAIMSVLSMYRVVVVFLLFVLTGVSLRWMGQLVRGISDHLSYTRQIWYTIINGEWREHRSKTCEPYLVLVYVEIVGVYWYGNIYMAYFSS